jgi:hypothetical protein
VTARDRGLRRAGLVTAVIAAGGIVGTGAVAFIAHADTTAATTATTESTSTTTTTDDNSSVTDGSGSIPQAQSGGS